MFDYQTLLMILGVLALLAVMFMILVRPNSTGPQKHIGLGRTGRPGSRNRKTSPAEIAPPPDAGEPPQRESKSA